MAAMRAAGFQDCDPHRVELERLGEIEVARLGEGLDLLVEQTLEIVERRVALGQVAEARVACVALITMVAAPTPAGAILFGEQPAAFLQLCQQVGRADIEIGRHTSELLSLMRSSYAVFCVQKKTTNTPQK